MKIKNVETKNNLFLAPMAGVTDFAFRSLVREFGAGLSYTEMVSVKALAYESAKTRDLLFTLPTETPVAVQIFGSDKTAFEKVLNTNVFSGFDIIDINMGCPAPKIVKNGDGSVLMKNFQAASEIVKTCKAATDKPVTVKMRLGFDKDVSVDFAHMLEDSGADAICVHGRLRTDFYAGKVNLDAIQKVKASVKIPVIGNGDVTDAESYKRMLETGVDAVMIGRGALGKPWIFSELLGQKMTIDKMAVVSEHIQRLRTYFPDAFIAAHIKRHLLWYLKDEKGAAKTKLDICSANSVDESLKIMEDFFKTKA